MRQELTERTALDRQRERAAPVMKRLIAERQKANAYHLKKNRRRFEAKSATSEIIVTISTTKRWKKPERPWEAEPLSLWENSFNADFEAVDNFGAAPA